MYGFEASRALRGRATHYGAFLLTIVGFDWVDGAGLEPATNGFSQPPSVRLSLCIRPVGLFAT